MTAAEGNDVTVLDVTTGRPVQVLRGHRAVVMNVAFSRDGRLLASCDGDLAGNDPGEIKVWDVASGHEIQSFRSHTDPIFCVAFSPDGKRLVSASQDNTIKVWDLETDQEALTLRAHWDATPWNESAPRHAGRTLRGHADRVFHAAISPDGSRLASVCREQVVVLWDAPAGRELAAFRYKPGKMFTVAFSPDRLPAGT